MSFRTVVIWTCASRPSAHTSPSRETLLRYEMGETDDDRRPEHLRSMKKAPTADAMEASVAVPPEGIEPPTYGTGNRRSIP